MTGLWPFVKQLRWAALPLIALIAALLFSAAMREIGGSSEAREAQVMSAIVRDGTWVLPLRNGIVPSKPPLMHWVGALIGEQVGGVTPLIARFPSITASILLLLVVGVWTAWRLRSQRPDLTHGEVLDLGVFSALILATSHGFLALAADARVDAGFILFCTVALVGGIEFERTGKRTWEFLGAASLGAAVLAKGPMAIPMCGGLLLAWLLSRRTLFWALRFICAPRWSWCLVLLIACPWYLAAASRGGDAFVERQIFFENLLRIVGGERTNSEPWWFYFPEIFRTAAPWSILLLLAWVFRRDKRLSPEQLKDARGFSFLVVAGVIGLSLVSGKRSSYLVVLFPWIACALTVFLYPICLSGRLRSQELSRKILVIGGLSLLTIAGGLEGVDVLSSSAALTEARGVALAWIAVHRPEIQWMIVVIAGLGVWSLRSRSPVLLLSTILPPMFVLLMGVGLGVKAELKGFSRSAEDISRRVGHDRVVVVKEWWDEYFDPILFYLHREVEVRPLEEIVRPCDGWMVTRRSTKPELPAVASYREINETKRSSPEVILVQCSVLDFEAKLPEDRVDQAK